jgi:hypothetical protein
MYMAERLLQLGEVAKRLGVSKRQFYRLRPRLIARGLQEITVGQHRKYRERSLDLLIQNAAENGHAL